MIIYAAKTDQCVSANGSGEATVPVRKKAQAVGSKVIETSLSSTYKEEGSTKTSSKVDPADANHSV